MCHRIQSFNFYGDSEVKGTQYKFASPVCRLSSSHLNLSKNLYSLRIRINAFGKMRKAVWRKLSFFIGLTFVWNIIGVQTSVFLFQYVCLFCLFCFVLNKNSIVRVCPGIFPGFKPCKTYYLFLPCLSLKLAKFMQNQLISPKGLKQDLWSE